tara:strand:+ start:9539 stop:10471 length:933 start_codon:yes stop_codon:yes gene_type:complete
MIKIFTLKDNIKFSSEQIILFGILNNYNSLTIEPHNYNFKGESRYNNVIETCNKLFIYVDNIKDCDIIVFPYKFAGANDNKFNVLFNLSQNLKKPLYIFFNDDYDKPLLPYSQYIKIYRTSFNKSTKNENEFSLPAFSPDYYDNNLLHSPKLSIGYCGHKIHGRDKYLNLFLNSNIETNFILRNGFWAPGIDKLKARKDYIENINNNLFTFCYRGAGNFSYRFYDVMMMGRIPILIKTDSVYPFEDKYDLNSVGVVIEEIDIMKNNIDLIKIIKDYYENNKDKLYNIQKQNRQIWEKYYSCCGFLENIIQ